MDACNEIYLGKAVYFTKKNDKGAFLDDIF